MATLARPILGEFTPEESDASLSLERGWEALKGSGSVAFQGFGGEFLKGMGLTDTGNEWMSSAYARGILMGMDMNDIDERIKGPKTWEEVDDWKGAIAWGINSVADQVPTLVGQFAPAITVALLARRFPSFGKRRLGVAPSTATAIATIDFMNTAEVYSQLLMETGESRPKVAMGTGAAMSVLDMIVPLKVLGSMGRGNSFAGWFSKQLKDPTKKWRQRFANSFRQGATEGITERLQTVMEGMALNYVQEKDILDEFTQAQRAEQVEAGYRGALIGALLGIPVSYRGMDVSAKKRADTFDDMVQRVMTSPETSLPPGRGLVPSGPYRDQYGRLDPMQPAGNFNRAARERQADFIREMRAPVLDQLWVKYNQAKTELAQLEKSAPIGQAIRRRADLLNPQPLVGDMVRWKTRGMDERGREVRIDRTPYSGFTIEGTVETGQRAVPERGPAEIEEVYGDGWVRLKGMTSPIQQSELEFVEISRETRAINKYKRDMIEAIRNAEMVASLDEADTQGIARLSDEVQAVRGQRVETFPDRGVPRESVVPRLVEEGLVEFKPELLEWQPRPFPVQKRGPEPPTFKDVLDVPTQRGQPRRGYEEWRGLGQRISTPGKRKDYGWDQTSSDLLFHESGNPKTSKGTQDVSIIYENADYILKKRANEDGKVTVRSPWIVIDKDTEEIVDTVAPAPNARTRIFKQYESDPIAVTPVSQVQAERVESLAQRFDQVQAERGMREVEVGQKVRRYKRNTDTGEWFYPDDEILTLNNIQYMTDPRLRGAQYTVETPVTTVYTVARESGATFDIDIGPTEDNLRLVPRLITGWKVPEFFGVVTPAEEIVEEELFVDEPVVTRQPQYDVEKTEEGEYVVRKTGEAPVEERVSEFTEEAMAEADVQQAIQNQKKFDELIMDDVFSETLAEALRDAETARAENITQSLDRLSKKTEEEIEQFIKDSKKTRTELGIPITARAAEEEKKFAYQAEKERSEYQEVKEREALQRVGEEVEEGEVGAPIIPDVEADIGLLEAPLELSKEEKKTKADRQAKARKRFGIARGAITTYKKKRGLTVTAAEMAKVTEEAEKAGITVVQPPPVEERRFEGVPKGGNLLDVIDLDTDFRPIDLPDIYEVKVSEKAAKEHGLNTSFFYSFAPYEGVWWADDYVKIEGQLIRKIDVDEVREVTGKAKAPTKPLSPAEKEKITKEGDEIQKRIDDLEEQMRLHKKNRKKVGQLRVKLEEEEVRLAVLRTQLEGGFIRGRGKENVAYWIKGSSPGMQDRVTLPDSVPDQDKIDEWWIDNRTGIILVREKLYEEGKPIDYTMKAYLTWVNREEHAIKLEEVFNKSIQLDREAREIDPVTRLAGDIKIHEEGETVDLRGRFGRKFMTKDYAENTRGADVTVTVKPSVIGRINKEIKKRKEQITEDILAGGVTLEGKRATGGTILKEIEDATGGLVPIKVDTQFPVTRYSRILKKGLAGEMIEAGRKEGDVVFPMSLGPEYRRGAGVPDQLRIVHNGESYIIDVESALTATLTRKIPARIGSMVEYEGLVERGPETGVRLIGTWRGDIPTDALALDKFMEDTFTPKTHAFGRYGEHKEKYLNQRTEVLKDAEDNKNTILVEYFDGDTIEGQVLEVNKEAGTFTLGIPIPKPRPEAKQRHKYLEIGILDYDRLQVAVITPEKAITKPLSLDERRTLYQGRKAQRLRELKNRFNDVVYLPVVGKPELVAVPGVEVGEAERTRVDVRGADGVYTISVDGRDEENKFNLNEAINFLNEVSVDNEGQIEVGSLPEVIIADNVIEVIPGAHSPLRRQGEGYRKTRPRGMALKQTERVKFKRGFNTEAGRISGVVTEQKVIEIPDPNGVTRIRIDHDVTITFNKGRRKPREGKFTGYHVASKEISFLQKGKKKPIILPLEDISYAYKDDALVLEEEADRAVEEINKAVQKNIVSQSEENKNADKEAQNEPISDEVYDAFVKKGTVPKNVEDSLTEKTANQAPLSPRETAIFIDVTATINKNLRGKVASEKISTYASINETPLGLLPLNHKFTDEKGGEWQVVQQVGKDRTILKFLGGEKPPIELRVQYNGKREVVEWQKNTMIITGSTLTPASLYWHGVERSIRPGVHGRTESRLTAVKIEGKGEMLIPNFSVVRESLVDGRGSITINTGLTPKRFREVLGAAIGRFNLARLEKGVVRIVQNQQDVPDAPTAMGIKSLERDGQVWFITNNIRESEIEGLFAHEVGVHIGLEGVFGTEVLRRILDSARALKNSSPEWMEAFARAQEVFDVLHETPGMFTDKIKDNIWKDMSPQEIQDWITEEAIGYYSEAANPLDNSWWRQLKDFFIQAFARGTKFFGKNMSEAQILAFIRGGIRGTMARNFEAAKRRTAEHYSASFAWDSSKPWDESAYDKFSEKVNDAINKLNDADTHKWQERLAAASSFRKSIGRFFNTFRELPYEGLFRKLRSFTQGELSGVADLGDDILKIFADLSEADNIELFKFFTNKYGKPEDISNVKLREVAVDLKKQIMKIGQDAFNRGIIPAANKEQFEELQGAYLPQVFLAHILGSKRPSSTPFGFKTSEKDWTKLRKDLAEWKKEGMVPITDVRYLLWRAFVIPQQDMIIMDFLERLSKHKVFTVDKETGEVSTSAGEAPWVMPGQWHKYEFTDPDGKTIKRRSTIPAMRREMEGYQNLLELPDSKVPEGAKNIAREQIGIIQGEIEKFYKEKGLDFDEKVDTRKFKRIPSSNRFGALAGLWVRKEIHEDIVGNADMAFGEQNFFSKMFSPHGAHARAVGIFKTLKVPLNPPSVIRNFVSNSVLMQLIGGMGFRKQPKYLLAALYEVSGGKYGKDMGFKFKGKTAYQIAKEQGIDASTMTSAEIRKLERMFFDMEKEGFWSVMSNFQKYWSKTADFGSGVYRNMEIMGKTAYIMYSLREGQASLVEAMNQPKFKDRAGNFTVNIEDVAVQEANRVLFDYSEVHPLVRGLRSSFFGAPFITFQVKVLPELLKVAARKPWRFLPYIMMYASIQAAFGSLPFVDDDWDKLKKLLPEWVREKGHAMILPWKDLEGRWQAIDLSYFFPWTAYLESAVSFMKGQPLAAVSAMGFIAPGWQVANAMLSNKDTWSGQQIVDPNDATSDQVFDMLNYGAQMSLPSLITRMGFASVPSVLEAMVRLDPQELEGKMFDAVFDRTNRYGEPKRDMVQALLSIIGVGTYSIPSQARGIQYKRYTGEIKRYEREISKARDNKRLSSNERKRKIGFMRESIEETKKERSDFMRETAGIKVKL